MTGNFYPGHCLSWDMAQPGEFNGRCFTLAFTQIQFLRIAQYRLSALESSSDNYTSLQRSSGITFTSTFSFDRGSVLAVAYHSTSHAGRIIMKIVYGYDIKDEGDHYVWLIDEHFRIINERCDIGSIFLVDYIPSCE